MRFITNIVVLCLFAHANTALSNEYAPRAGTTVSGNIFVGQGQARVFVPLPAGDWHVFHANETEMTMQGLDQHMAPTRLDILLLQRAGTRIPMTIRIQASKDPLPGRITSLVYENPCKREDTIHRNPYGSAGTIVDCLLINHLTGYLGKTVSGMFAELKTWMTKEGLAIPNTVLSATYSQNLPNRFLTVTITIDPGVRKLDSSERNWTANPFNKARLVLDGDRQRYVKEYIAWAEAYKPLLSISRPGPATSSTIPAEIPSFR